MSFILPTNGTLTVDQLNKFIQTNQGSYGSLANANTPEAKAFLKRMQDFQAVRDRAVTGARNGVLTDADAKRVRDAASGIPDSRVAAQRSQIRSDAQTPPPSSTRPPEDPYRDTNGMRYRKGPSSEEVRFKGASFREGDSGEGVKALQKQLLEAGFDLGPKGADGYFGPKTAAAAEKFLKQHVDLKGQLDSRAVERAAGVVEGKRSVDRSRAGSLDSK